MPVVKSALTLSLLAVFGLQGCAQFNEPTSPTVARLSSNHNAIQDWQNMRFGMFIHFGAYADLAGVWKGKQIEKLGEQIQRHAYIPHDEYEEVVKGFNPVNFDADHIAQIAKDAGMKYIVITAKHHDGFAMFDSKHTQFDIVDFTQYKRDLLKSLADATKRKGLKLGVYYSTPDWHFNGPTPEVNPRDGKISVFGKVSKANEDYQVAQLEELMTHYGDIVEVFFDMGEPTPAQSRRFRDVVKKHQPNALINGRIMNDQGDFLTMPDNHVPDTPITAYPWETPGTFYHTWGYKSWVKGKPVQAQVSDQVRKLSDIASMGGNFLLNIGPKGDGSILQYEQDVLAGVGKWVQANKEAIFSTGLNPFLKLDWGQVTTSENTLYLHIHHWPKDNKLVVPGLNNTVYSVAPLLAPTQHLPVYASPQETVIDLSQASQDAHLTVLKLTFDGELSITPKHTKANAQGELVIAGNRATKHGKFGKQSYRSMLKDYARSWYIDVPKAGMYQAQITYKMKYKSKDFVLESDADRLPFTLTGKGQMVVNNSLFDGNEKVQQEVDTKGRFQIALLENLYFDKPGLQQLKLKQGKPFELLANSDDFFKQDQKYRSMNIEIDAITLTPQYE